MPTSTTVVAAQRYQAHRFEKLIRDGEVRDYADLARLGHVTRARLTQIMNLLLLAPDIQEQILLSPAVEAGRDPVLERQLRTIVAKLDWRRQRRMWQQPAAVHFLTDEYRSVKSQPVSDSGASKSYQKTP